MRKYQPEHYRKCSDGGAVSHPPPRTWPASEFNMIANFEFVSHRHDLLCLFCIDVVGVACRLPL